MFFYFFFVYFFFASAVVAVEITALAPAAKALQDSGSAEGSLKWLVTLGVGAVPEMSCVPPPRGQDVG